MEVIKELSIGFKSKFIAFKVDLLYYLNYNDQIVNLLKIF